MDELGAPIACNQFEYHVLLGQGGAGRVRRASRDVPVVAYAPLAQGRLAEHEELRRHRAQARRDAGAGGAEMAARPGRRGGDPEGEPARERSRPTWTRCASQLDDADRAAIATLPKANRFVNPGFAPAWDRVG